jgi:hypothetical protein
MKRAIAAALVASVVSGPAMAAKDNNSGNQLLEDCTSKRGSISRGFCTGFVQGFMHGITVFKKIGATIPYCTPDQVTIGQRRDIFINYLQAHPESRHNYAGMLYSLAMTEKFPCK